MNKSEFQEKYPTLAKIDDLGKKWGHVMQFLLYLEDSGFIIETPDGNRLGRYEGILHEYFGIDAEEAERERQDLLASLRD